MTIQWARRPRKHLPSRATTNDKCYICNRYGHFARDCPDIGTAAPVRRSPPRYRGGRGRRGREGYSPRRRSYSPRRRSNSPRRRTRSRSPYRLETYPETFYIIIQICFDVKISANFVLVDNLNLVYN